MPRRPSLEPKLTTKKHAPFVVNLPGALSNTGKRERRYFDNRKAAEEFCKQQRIRLENYGTASTLLPAGKVDEAVAAFEKLNGTGATLLEAVTHYIAWKARLTASVTFKEMFGRFAEAKSSRSPSYRIALRTTLPRFGALHDRLVLEITPADIDDQTQGMSVSVRNAFLRNIRAAFNFGIRRGWCQENPVKRLEMQTLRSRREILTNKQVAALLRVTRVHDFTLLPYQLLCLFAGIRPKEAERLTWDNVNLKERFVEVPDEMSKTQTRRIVDIEPLLASWLAYYVKRGGNTEGPVVPQSKLRHRLRAIRKAAKFERWPQDAPRRTYASNWLAVNHDVNRLNNLMGHTSPEMLWRHYHRAVTKKNAVAFWRIGPPRGRRKELSKKKTGRTKRPDQKEKRNA